MTVKPGDSILSAMKAANFNKWEAVGDAFKKGQLAALTGGAPNRTGRILVRNNTGSDLARFNIVGLGGPIITPTISEPMFCDGIALQGVTPETPTHNGLFAVVQTPLASGQVGEATIVGETIVKLDVVEAIHNYADITDDEVGFLTTSFTGTAKILWQDSGSDPWAIVQLGSVPDTLLGKVTEAVGPCTSSGLGTGTIEVYTLDIDDIPQPTMVETTVYNFCGDGVTVDSFVFCKTYQGRMIVDTVCCTQPGLS
jgi:hypothetical protein